jgi:molecular chaperone GrpE
MTEPTHSPETAQTTAENDDASSADLLETELEKLQAEAAKFRDLALRTQADFENFRKRMLREKEEALRYANAGLMEKLLPILDSFELGLQAARQDEGAGALVQGFAMVEKQMQDFLRDHGVETVEAVGQTFDPNLHEAVSQQNDPAVPEGCVLHQLRKGYKLKDRLLRPSTVIVSKGPAAE